MLRSQGYFSLGIPLTLTTYYSSLIFLNKTNARTTKHPELYSESRHIKRPTLFL